VTIAADHGVMPWTTTHDPVEFLAVAGGFLRSRLVEHNLILTITDQLRRGGPLPEGPTLLGWWTGAAGPAGAFSRTPGFPLAVTPMPGPALDELADLLVPPLPGIGTGVAAARRFARRWQARTGAGARVTRRDRLYRLGQLAPPDPLPPGRARLAVGADRDLLHAWHEDFQQEISAAGEPDIRVVVADRLGYGGLVLWEAGGEPVAMASRSPVVAGISRVTSVYTPPPQRRHGYGAAVTAAVSRQATEVGAAEVVLYTDAGNPGPNALYQRLGYRLALERLVIAFT
jgi:predicted GNAT family acetyltransferase